MAQVKIALPTPHPAQQKILDRASRYNIVAMGEQGGKTTLGIEALLASPKGALNNRAPVAWFSADDNSLVQARRQILRLIDPLLKRRVNARRVELVSGGVIDFYFGCTDVLAYDLAIALSAWGFDAEGRPMHSALRAFQKGYESVRPLSDAERQALPELGAAAAVRFTLTRLHDLIFHDPAHLVTPKDPGAFLRRLDWWEAVT